MERALAYAVGKAKLHLGSTLQDGVVEAGRWVLACAQRAGLGVSMLVHVLGDGAHWISEQVEQRFGKQGRFTVDFHHLSDYLAAAAKVCSADPQAWLHTQQEHLKHNRLKAMLAALMPHLDPGNLTDAPVRACLRYLDNRTDQLDDQGALAQGLPIGSDEIESTHRYIVQQRLQPPAPGGPSTTPSTRLTCALIAPSGSGRSSVRNVPTHCKPHG